MFQQMVSLLLQVAGGLFAGACLLRWYMQWLRVSFQNPLGSFVLGLTDWLVLPLRKITKALPGGDWASLLGAWLVQLLQYALLWLVAGGVAPLAATLVVATIGVANIALSGLVVMLLVRCLMSWLSTGNAVMQAVFHQLTEPLLRPLRRFIPLIGGVDVTPIALMVLLQMLAIALAHLQAQLLTVV